MAGRSDFQGIFIGGFQPFFRFKLTAQDAEGFIISSSSSESVDVTILDSTETTVTFTSAVVGTQYLITPVIEYIADLGEIPTVELSSNNDSISTIDVVGNTGYVSTGTTKIIGTSEVSERGVTYTSEIDITNSTSGGVEEDIVTFVADPINVSDHILILWNSNEADSTTAKNYYLANRPEFGTYSGGNTPNTLDCPCTTTGGFEFITEANFNSQIRTHVIDFLTDNPTKPIRYIVLMYGMPSRISNSTKYSSQYRLYLSLQDTGARTGDHYQNAGEEYSLGGYQGTSCLVTSLNMNTLADTQAYIDKLKTIYDGMGSSTLIISAEENGQGGDSYHLDDTSRIYSYSRPASLARAAILEQDAGATITLSGDGGDTDPTPDQTSHIISAANVSGYSTWGANGGQGGDYSNGGGSFPVTFSGQSNWYIIRTIESYNGRRSTFQGNVTDWFKTNAFGGTSYSNTPAFAVSHVEEPYLSGVNDGEFFGMWATDDSAGSKFLAIEAGWSSRNTPYFQCAGDPLITR